MGQELDLRNLTCPEPVMRVKKALSEIPAGTIVARVNGEAPRVNIVNFAKSQNYAVEVTKDGDEHVIRITKSTAGTCEACQTEATAAASLKGKVFFITSEALGQGSDDLGKTLMQNLILTLMDSGVIPEALLFVNSGVKLCAEGSPVLEFLRVLESKGVKILSCGTCLNFYGIAGNLQVGEVTTMVTIMEYLAGPYQVVTL